MTKEYEKLVYPVGRCPRPSWSHRVRAWLTALETLKDRVNWGAGLIGVPSIWKGIGKGEDARVAVLDTGKPNHPDLGGAVLEARDFTGIGVEDKNGHSTGVCGVIAARQDDRGIVGVAPRCSLIVGKVLGDNGSGDYRWIADGIRWAVEQDADVINLSLGGPEPHHVLQSAVAYAYEQGVTVVAAAGNDGHEDLSRITVGYPARYKKVLSVGSIDRDKSLSEYSSVGKVDFALPGRALYTTWLDGTYRRLSGTSFSSPLLTGIIALLVSYARKEGDTLSPLDVKHELQGASLDLGPEGFDKLYGWGIVRL